MTVELLAPSGRLFVGGAWRPPRSGVLQPAENPADETVITDVPWGDADDVDDAVDAASDAAPAWAAMTWGERSSLLREIAARLRRDVERLAHVDTADSGNPIDGSRKDVLIGAAALEHFSGLGGQVKGETLPSGDGAMTFTEREPFGVVGRLLAFNHPLMFIAQGIAAPLITGNTIVVKPADTTVLSALEFAKIAEDVLPAGVLNVVPGPGDVAGHALVGHPRVPRIAFTGSVGTGRTVLRTAAEHIKTVTLELGGKNPLIVFPDADPVAAAAAAVDGMNFKKSNGQSCQSTSRVLVHEDVHDAFVEALTERILALSVGRPDDSDVDMGPLAFRQHYERVLAAIDRARAEGAHLAAGGGRPPGLDRGYYVEPTLFTQVKPAMAIAREEVFGPVLAVLSWSSFDEMIDVANGTEYGLTANVVTNDLNSALRTGRRVRAGMIWVNGPSPRAPGTPFGGFKNSGLGREHGLGELLSYTQEKSMIVRVS